jgi:hypothetical protein
MHTSSRTRTSGVIGTPSGLQRDDQLLAVAGTSVRGLAGASALDPPPSWEAGRTTELRVLRQGRTIDLAVPIVQWIPAPWCECSWWGRRCSWAYWVASS